MPVPVDVTVTTAGGTSPTSAADQFTYVAAPTVTAIAPASGPTAGGTVVVITGTNLGRCHRGRVRHRGRLRHRRHRHVDHRHVAGRRAGPVDVTVTTAGGTSATVAADLFTYVAAPTVTSISPASGPDDRRHVVVITGTEPRPAPPPSTSAPRPATVTADTATSITATSPAGSGTVDVTVTTAGGTSATSAADKFTYLGAPAVTAIAPTTGPTAGGTGRA